MLVAVSFMVLFVLDGSWGFAVGLMFTIVYCLRVVVFGFFRKLKKLDVGW